jgi:threonine dehydratase
VLDLALVQAARARIAGRVHVTPTMTSSMLGARVGVRLFHKCENFQKTGSFKSRGALNKVGDLGEDARRRGVVTFSAGNHAQALAWAARAANVACTVVMPTWATATKVDASRGYGAEVVLHGTSGIEALAKANELVSQRGLVFVHPFDDELIAAGQGTAALELLEQTEGLDVVVVPIGGGGLIAGIATAVKGISPRTRIYGIEPEGAAAMRASLDAGRPVRLDAVKTIADGLAAPMAGTLNYDVVRRLVDDVILVSDAVIADGLRELVTYTKLLAEPAGATATAALLSGAVPVKPGERVACIVSGGNVDLGRLVSETRDGIGERVGKPATND